MLNQNETWHPRCLRENHAFTSSFRNSFQRAISERLRSGCCWSAGWASKPALQKALEFLRGCRRLPATGAAEGKGAGRMIAGGGPISSPNRSASQRGGDADGTQPPPPMLLHSASFERGAPVFRLSADRLQVGRVMRRNRHPSYNRASRGACFGQGHRQVSGAGLAALWGQQVSYR